jgi:aerobic carbon-monoxide dehydrogenase large subunit
MQYGVGQPVRRSEDPRFLTGTGTYLNDINRPNQAHAAMLYSPHAHAKINSIDISAAKKSPGVLLVLTGAEISKAGLGPVMPRFMPEDMGGPKGYRTERPVLAIDTVRHVGDRVAMVVAETLAEAQEALEMIEVDYQVLPCVVNADAASKADAPLVFDDADGNISFTLHAGDATATDAAFANAAHIVQADMVHPRLNGGSLETRGAIGEFDAVDDRYTLFASTQLPHILRSELCRMVFGIPDSQMRVVTKDVGGGFGLKTNPFPEDALVLFAAKQIGRPVKWIASRSEHTMTDDHGRDQWGEGDMAIDKDGKILAIRTHAKTNVGAYIIGSGANPANHYLRLLMNVYNVPTVDVTCDLVMTHTSPTVPYRGAGRPEGVYAVERLIDKAADVLGIDRTEIRRRNFIAPEDMPAKTHMNFIYDSGEFETVMDKALEKSDWDGFAARKTESESKGNLRGIGISNYIEDAGALNERIDLRVDTSGIVTILSGLSSTGQGHETVFKQMVAEWLSVPFEDIRFVQNDTDRVPVGRGTYASRSMVVGSNALNDAVQKVIEKGKGFAAHMMEASVADIEYSEGKFSVSGTDKAVPFQQVAMMSYKPMGLPPELGIGLEANGEYSVTMSSFPNGCHVCEVEIDPDTGEVVLDRYNLVDDIGNVMNPLLAEGQMHGGVAQGVGEALFENTHYDAESGQILSGTFMDYCMPRAHHLPNIGVEFHEVPCKNNPTGVKGAGEGGTVGATPAVMSAILDALKPFGVDHVPLPATPNAVWRAIQEKKTA